MRRRIAAAAALLVTGLACAGGAWAQDQPQETPDPPPHISLIDGSATVDRDGKIELAITNSPLLDGDRIGTSEGRVEIVLSDGSLLHLDRFTSVDLMSPALLRLTDGRVRLTVVNDPRGAIRYRVDGPGASVQVESAGEYRIAVLGSPAQADSALELAVVRGWAQLNNDRGFIPVRAGERSMARADERPSMPVTFNIASYDAFDRWIDGRRTARTGVVSSQYLPTDLYAYAGTFDRHGYWGRHETYGPVWYPTVSYGWRPYWSGGWWPYRRYGLVWVGNDPWDWPTHHYGSWGVTSVGSWFWVPGRRWGAAWVSWGSAPNYLAWCPLGYNGLPVVGFGVGYGYDPWRAWTVVPRASFAYGRPIHGWAVSGRSLSPHVRTAFVSHGRTPVGLPAYHNPVGRPGSQFRTAGSGSGSRRGVDGARPPDGRIQPGTRPAGATTGGIAGPGSRTAETLPKNGDGEPAGGISGARASYTPSSGTSRGRELAPSRRRAAPGAGAGGAAGVVRIAPSDGTTRALTPKGPELEPGSAPPATGVPRAAPERRRSVDDISAVFSGRQRYQSPQPSAPPEQSSGTRRSQPEYAPPPGQRPSSGSGGIGSGGASGGRQRATPPPPPSGGGDTRPSRGSGSSSGSGASAGSGSGRRRG